ncbi:hypothetical protein B5807_09417 [Epicoccum nigrum]|uniref:Uncharacterized protein n=1 Tax=Epicoccum nigrum TaxID=105696 RepID=A0A1Y2LMP7_EPING|nr:hypothetical protein B5807_09417 [Epicoccum nigrum]
MSSALSSRAARRFRLVTSVLVLAVGNYELWRIHKGIHPYWTPRLEEAGIVRQRNKLPDHGSLKPDTVSVPAPVAAAAAAAAAAASEKPAPKAWIKWTDLNGVPIPTLETSIRPTRKD